MIATVFRARFQLSEARFKPVRASLGKEISCGLISGSEPEASVITRTGCLSAWTTCILGHLQRVGEERAFAFSAWRILRPQLRGQVVFSLDDLLAQRLDVQMDLALKEQGVLLLSDVITDDGL